MNTTSRDLARLYSDAALERAVVIENRSRAGEDPHHFLSELPTVEELVVHELMTERIDQEGLTAQYLLARLASLSSRSGAADHRHDTDALEVRVLRDIALQHPQLTRTIWSMMGKIGLS